jgi:hypothetical protein
MEGYSSVEDIFREAKKKIKGNKACRNKQLKSRKILCRDIRNFVKVALVPAPLPL